MAELADSVARFAPTADRPPPGDAAGGAWAQPLRLPLHALAPALCLILAVASVAAQGFAFGVDNNLFHIPIVLRWYDLPQFADDAFIQSLRRYATPVFPALSLVSDESNIRTVFLVCHVATRALTLWGLSRLVRSVGLGALEAAAAVTAIALASIVYGLSRIGEDELFIGVFTHTALAQAAAIWAIAWMLRGKAIKAALAAAVAFDINFMVGAWTLAPLLAAAVSLTPRPAPQTLAAAAGLFAAGIAPVVGWALASQSLQPVGFDYHAYLADYYPNHFFIGWASWSERASWLLQVLAGVGAAACLPRRRLSAGLALGAFVLLFVAGAAVDQVSHARLVLNLHLLRSDGLMQWLTAALVVAGAVASLARGRLLLAPAAVLALAGLAADSWGLAAAGVWILLLLRQLPPWSPVLPVRAAGWRLAAALVAMAAVGAVFGTYAPGASTVDPAWTQVTDWARTRTPAAAVFLAPWKRDFITAAERRSWVGWKEGAAAMWAPETHAAWKQRSDEVRGLRSADAQLAYACAHHIDYVIFERQASPLPGLDSVRQPAFDNGRFLVARPACPRG